MEQLVKAVVGNAAVVDVVAQLVEHRQDLLLGVVRIFSRKVSYLLKCSAILTQKLIDMA